MQQLTPLAEALQQARRAQDLSIRELARLLEVAPSAVLRWETAERVPTPALLAALAAQLELRASDLFKLAGVPIPSDVASLPAMLRADYDLPTEAIADIEAYIAAVAKQHRGTTKRSSNSIRNEGRET